MSQELPKSSRIFELIRRRPSPFVGAVVSIAAFMVVVYVQVMALGKWQAGLTYALPLFLCLWTRQRSVLYLLAASGSILGIYKNFWLIGDGAGTSPKVSTVFQLINIWTSAFAIHIAIYALNRLDLKRKALTDNNEELEEANKELATREEQVVQQNQELQTQAEELGRQAEELRQQAEELEQQTVELHAANDELTRRERGLQTLLESARWMRSDLSESDVMSAICQAAVQVMEEGVSAAAIVHNVRGVLELRGHYGFGVHGTLREEVPWDRSFAHVVTSRAQTAYIADIASRPDIMIPQPAAGRPFRSALATPLTMEGRIIGAVAVYAPQPREWTDGEFKVIEWLAAQCALALQAIESQREVIVKRREAEEASVQKTRFLAAVSHDVRTPANAISLLADLIEQAAARSGDPASGGGREIPMLARDLKDNARSLVELVSDVLDLTRLDAGRSDLQVSEFPLNGLIASVVRQFDRIADEKKLRLTAELCPDDPVVRTDKTKLTRIVSNLLGNAVKFTEAGSVEVQCRLLSGGDHGSAAGNSGGISISVTDTGVGIPHDALPRIFDEFYQLQNPERDRNKGSGLGLAICKRLVDALGCSLAVESTLGVGTTFTITLPLTLRVSRGKPGAAPDEAAAHTRAHAAAPLGDGTAHTLAGACVLIVEDHDVTRRAAARLLAGRGAVVLEARSAREALHFLVHEEPHVLLLDLMLPDADGTDILRHLRLHRPASLRCVLAVSGDVRDARLSEVKELGADDLVPKPLDIDKLIGVITTRLATSPP